MNPTRRDFLMAAGVGATGTLLPTLGLAGDRSSLKKTHLVTLSFDDGFKKSFTRIAEIYEKHGLSACLNVIATGHQKTFQPPDQYIGGVPLGDFDLWNELRQRGHEIMPHGYQHANLRQLTFQESKALILRCLDVFSRHLQGFDPREAVFNFPYNASTPELEEWLPTQVKAFRTRGNAVNRLPTSGPEKLGCTGFGPGNCEATLDREIEKLLAEDSGWLIFNTHGLDDEGWGPLGATYLDGLLARLTAIESVDVLPAGRALVKYAETGRAT